MTKTETAKWAEQQRIARTLMHSLQDADRNEDDVAAAQVTAKLEAMGYTVEWTSAGIMVSS